MAPIHRQYKLSYHNFFSRPIFKPWAVCQNEKHMLRPCPSSVVFIHWWHPRMEESSMDDILRWYFSINGWHFSIHGWHSSIHGWHSPIHGWHFSIYGWHPWMTFLHPWMASKDGIQGWHFHPWMEVLSVDVIHEWLFHPWMPSMDDIHGWRRRMTDMDAASIQSCFKLWVKDRWASTEEKCIFIQLLRFI